MYEHHYRHDEHRTHSVPIPDEYHCCESCEHWRGDYFNKVLAESGRSMIYVGQCAADDDNAPGVAGVDGFVFTQPDQCCPAFCIQPDVLAEIISTRTDYARMERERWTA